METMKAHDTNDDDETGKIIYHVHHNVDFYPTERTNYQYPGINNVRCLGGSKIYVGSCVITPEDFRKCNGYPNNFWYYAIENKYFTLRCRKNKIRLDFSINNKTFIHDPIDREDPRKIEHFQNKSLHNHLHREADIYGKTKIQCEGLNNCEYTVLEIENIDNKTVRYLFSL